MDILEIDEEFVKESSKVLDHMDDIIPREEVESLLDNDEFIGLNGDHIQVI